jgi:hypothetical protein
MTHHEFRKKWQMEITPPNGLRGLIEAIQKVAQGHKEWPVAESMLRPAFDAMLIYAANMETSEDNRKMHTRIVELTNFIWNSKHRKKMWRKRKDKRTQSKSQRRKTKR